MNVSRRCLFLKSFIASSCVILKTCGNSSAKVINRKETHSFFKLYPVGTVERKGKTAHLRIFKKYADALKGLDGFSHMFVLYWFDKNDIPKKRSVLQVRPRGNKSNPLTGVFACRAPVRPNLIALSLCKILSVEGCFIHIDKIDALDNSPILDIKPYIPAIDSVKNHFKMPDWLRK